MTMYAGQEAEPQKIEARIHLLESEIEAGADPETLMTEHFRRTVHKSLPKTDDSDILGLTPTIEMDTLTTLAKMAENPFNHQARVLHEMFLERGKRQGRAAITAANILVNHQASLRQE